MSYFDILMITNMIFIVMILMIMISTNINILMTIISITIIITNYSNFDLDILPLHRIEIMVFLNSNIHILIIRCNRRYSNHRIELKIKILLF